MTKTNKTTARCLLHTQTHKHELGNCCCNFNRSCYVSVYLFPSSFLPLLPPVAQTTLPWQPKYMRDGALRWDDSEGRKGGGGLETRPCERVRLDVCTPVEQLWIFLYTRQSHTIISFNAVCAPSGEIKANEMWQMNADMKTKSWAPSGPNALNTPIYIT